MAGQKRTRGKCAYCQRDLTRTGMGKHLAECPVRIHAIAEAFSGAGKPQPLYHVQVQDAWGGDFWLHLEVNGEATLKQLDRYLRAIWLECCGHLSAFYLDREYGAEAAMTRKVEQVFKSSEQLFHIYDFGTSSKTIVKVLGTRHGKPLTRHPIALMARNSLPEYTCMTCGEPATYICLQCLNEDDTTGELCDVHVEDHPHSDYGDPMPLVNSPRSGVCGYEGPAEPPY